MQPLGRELDKLGLTHQKHMNVNWYMLILCYVDPCTLSGFLSICNFQIFYLALLVIFNCFLFFLWHSIYFQIFLIQAAGCVGLLKPRGT